MGYISHAVVTDELHLPSDPTKWTVQMKRKGDYGVELETQDALLKINAEQLQAMAVNGNGKRQERVAETIGLSRIELAASKRALTLAMIVSWNLTDENDQPLPLTLENLNRLEPEDGRFLTEEALKRMPLRKTEEELRPFGRRSGSPFQPKSARELRRHGG